MPEDLLSEMVGVVGRLVGRWIGWVVVILMDTNVADLFDSSKGEA